MRTDKGLFAAKEPMRLRHKEGILVPLMEVLEKAFFQNARRSKIRR